MRDAPSAFRIPISRRRSSTRVYMVSKITRKLMATPNPTNELMKGLSSGKLEEVISDMYSAIERMR